MNPIWMQIFLNKMREIMKVCPHCKKAASYGKKPVGKFYRCRHCGHRFKEKGS